MSEPKEEPSDSVDDTTKKANGLLPQFGVDFEEIRFLSFSDDRITILKHEISRRIDFLMGSRPTDDPVFEGMTRDFLSTDQAFQSVLKSTKNLLGKIRVLCESLTTVSDVLVDEVAKTTDTPITSDCCKFREATSGLGRIDAPNSVVAKFQRDLQFNVTGPLNAHLLHNLKIKYQLETRRRRLQEFLSAKKFLQLLKNCKIQPNQSRISQAEAALESARVAFEEVDRPVFEWLLMLQEYRSDIYDSLVQTLKYLQYEFFAGSAHCIAHVLPKRMEFRPLIEMTPDQLKPLVEMELDNSVQSETGSNSISVPDSVMFSATSALLKRWQNKVQETESETTVNNTDITPVDPLSLSVLIAQGFKESEARQALKVHNNNCQDSLDCLLEQQNDNVNCKHKKELNMSKNNQLQKQVEESVRIPSTLKWVRKLHEYRLCQKKNTDCGTGSTTVQSAPKGDNPTNLEASKVQEEDLLELQDETAQSGFSKDTKELLEVNDNSQKGNSHTVFSENYDYKTHPKHANSTLEFFFSNELTKNRDIVSVSSSSSISSSCLSEDKQGKVHTHLSAIDLMDLEVSN